MSSFEKVVVLYGGQSGERSVSLHSAEPVIACLKHHYPMQAICLEENKLPAGLNPKTDVIFPVIHGDFGEDGQLQALLERHGFSYLGSNSVTSALCMHKMQSKRLAQAHHLPVLPGMEVHPGQVLTRVEVEAALKASAFVLKPENKGSSLGVHICPDFDALQAAWSQVTDGAWMIEPYAAGRELTVGILQGKALSVGEICPKQGFYDFHNKYTQGACEYLFPAPLEASVEQAIKTVATEFFRLGGCRDLARADFILDAHNRCWFLELNTIPGMTDQSLFPKSAAAVGIPFDALLQSLMSRFAFQEQPAFGLLPPLVGELHVQNS